MYGPIIGIFTPAFVEETTQMQLKKLTTALAIAGLTASGAALATNGMNLEGYGPIALGMGGASMAYDNGTAAVMNNPATLGLMADGNRLDVALGFLGPDVNSSMSGGSSANAFYMPAVGYAKKNGNLTYGVALFAQGGMGTEYAMGIDGMPERSELGVGRFIIPLTFNVNPNLSIGGSIDYVWAMLDMRMAMPLMNMAGLITPTGMGNGTLMGAIGGAMGAGYDNARLDFSDHNDFTGKAKATGFAGKLGFTYKASPTVTIGGAYHSKTALDDMKTSTNGTTMALSDTGGMPAMNVPGKLAVRDFQWPETYGLGVAWQATPKMMVAADWKHIGWADVMKNFTMTYSAMGDSVTFALPQNWDDQDVFSIGVSYQVNDALTLRAGANISDNPIPSSTMHYLFPAIEENHYTVGLGYAFNKSSDLNFALSHAAGVTQTSPMGYTVTHDQYSWQVMYSKKF